jgi:hypothetical protein
MRSNRPRQKDITKKASSTHNRLFGIGPQQRYLVGIATHGPITGRALARIMDIDPARMPSLHRRFTDVVARDRDMLLHLDETSHVHDELAAVLHHLAGHRFFILGPAAQATPPVRRLQLFGSPARTRVLVALGVLGGGALTDVALVAHVHLRTLHSIVRELCENDLATVATSGSERLLRLTESPLSAVLTPLLHRLATPQMARAAEFVRQRASERHATGRISSTVHIPIGTPAQADVLRALLAYGAGTTAHLAHDTGRSRNVVRTAIDGLERCDLVVSKTFGSGPTAARWVQVNEAHPVVPALCALVATVGKTAKRGELPPAGLPLRRPVRARSMPGPPLRTECWVRTVLDGEISVADLADKLEQPFWGPLRRHAESLRDAGLIAYGLVGGRPTLRALEDGARQARTDLAVAIEHFAQRR